MKRLSLLILLTFGFIPFSYATGQSTIVEAEGIACTSPNTTRIQADGLALTNAKRDASEKAGTHLESSTLVKDAEVQADLIKSFSNAQVKLITRLSEEWEQSGKMDYCLQLRIRAEVVPDPVIMKKVEAKIVNDPTAPLNVKIWVDKKNKVYKQGEVVHIYLQGNKPFFGRLVYGDAAKNNIQLLPNPYRKDNYFKGGVMYEIPEGHDRFEMEVTPPFGNETITVYASTSPSGDLHLKDAGSVYLVTTAPKDIKTKTRGIKINEVGSPTGSSSRPSHQRPTEFAETSVELRTTN
ncbi:DUF4384 domain-containing protein [Mariprofundus sp. EBB-1]|uniref:DUF4384 domain-containing protein n=1 Tax=Mariprofundus sp. EBB-1 TaxID=2650971 RepID=UPI000EF26087|nr:DUF4384 domain-containing protein [Mariprofundus sp. EBB-1]RLL50872.1 DUF4384 domain-containing protein [Mariprofundus sp. EBB-1]